MSENRCPKHPDPSPASTQEIQEQLDFELTSPDRSFLSGPRERIRDLATLFRVGAEMFKAFRALHFVGPCVTIFGSARTKEESPYYKLAVEMGEACAELGFTVMTGGGPGIMEAGNRGAYEAGGHSIGVNIELPFEQHLNPYVHKSITMRYFFTRKVVLVKYSYAFIVLPGGVGTMDEMFETMTLIQTAKIRNFPIVLMGKEFWQPMMDMLYKMVDEGTISPEDPDLIFFTDSVDEAKEHLKRHAVRQFGLKKHFLPKRSAILGEG